MGPPRPLPVSAEVELIGLEQSRNPELNGRRGFVDAPHTIRDGHTYISVQLAGDDGRPGGGQRAKMPQQYVREVPRWDALVPRPAAGERLGLSLRTSATSGVEITLVEPGSLSAAAGLRPGPRVVAVDGRKVQDKEGLTAAVRAARGPMVKMTLAAPPRVAEPEPDGGQLERGLVPVLAIVGLLSLCLATGLIVQTQADQQQHGRGHGGYGGGRGAAVADDGPDYYAALGLSKGADSSEAEVKKEYRKLSQKLHPDKNPSDEAKTKYQEVQAAYAVLSDRKKRKVYDIMGHDGLKELQGDERRGGRRSQHPFAAFFGDGFDGGDGSKGGDVEFDLRLSLADVYNGAEHTVPYDKLKLTSRDVVRGCTQCRAQPPRIQRVRMGPMIMNQQVPPDCTYECDQGQHTRQRRAELTVIVDRGIPDGHALRYEMEADEWPDRLPGDVVLNVATAPHRFFTRDGDDLRMELTIPLADALAGFSRGYDHMDGHRFTVSRPGVTPHGTEHRIVGEGMPRHDVPSERGDLLVGFKVEYPKRLTAAQKQRLRELLPDDAAAVDAARRAREESRRRRAEEGELRSGGEDEDGDEGG